MNLLEKLLNALGLDANTSEETLVTAVTTLHAERGSLQTTLNAVAKAAGLNEGAEPKVVTETVTALMAANTSRGGDSETIVALQAEISTLATELNTLKGDRSRERAVAFVDEAIKGAKVGVKPLRDHYITRHMANPAEVEKEISALPSLNASGTSLQQPKAEGAAADLTAGDNQVIALLGLDPKAFAEQRAKERGTLQAAL